MLCPKCGKYARVGELFCEGCGARIHTAAAADVSKAERPQKKRTRTFALFACLGVVAFVVFCTGLILFLKNREATAEPANADEYVAASASDGDEWKNVYRMFLEELLPERFGQSGARAGIRMTFLDVNFDGIPELLDCRCDADERFSVTAYYIMDGCTVVLGTAYIGESAEKGDTDLVLCYDAETDDEYYLSFADVGDSEYRVEEVCAWGSRASAAFPYCESIALVQSSNSADGLSDRIDQENIYFDSESNTYAAYAFYSAYVDPDAFESRSTAYINKVFLIDYSIAWLTDGDLYATDTAAHSIYQSAKSEGKTDKEAAGAVIDELFGLYETTQNRRIALDERQETQLVELALATLSMPPFRSASELTQKEAFAALDGLLCNNKNGRFSPDATYLDNGVVIPIDLANTYLTGLFGMNAWMIDENNIPHDIAASYTQEGLFFESKNAGLENCRVSSYRTLQDDTLFVEFEGDSLYDNTSKTCRMVVMPSDDRFGFRIISLCKAFN